MLISLGVRGYHGINTAYGSELCSVGLFFDYSGVVFDSCDSIFVCLTK